MPDTYWLLDEAPAIPIDYVTAGSGYVDVSRGATTTVECRFYPSDHSAINEPVVTGLSDRYRAARDLVEYASAATVVTGTDGVAYFRERVPNVAPVDTQFVKVRPPDHDNAPDYWGVVTGGRPRSGTDGDRRRLDLEIAYLGDVDDYPDRETARGQLEA